jgi:hypothetical protein
MIQIGLFINANGVILPSRHDTVNLARTMLLRAFDFASWTVSCGRSRPGTSLVRPGIPGSNRGVECAHRAQALHYPIVRILINDRELAANVVWKQSTVRRKRVAKARALLQ